MKFNLVILSALDVNYENCFMYENNSSSLNLRMAISNGDEANSNTEVDNVVSYRFNLKVFFVKW